MNAFTTAFVEKQLRDEMSMLSVSELMIFAKDMGVDVRQVAKDRMELIEACVAAELHAFTH